MRENNTKSTFIFFNKPYRIESCKKRAPLLCGLTFYAGSV